MRKGDNPQRALSSHLRGLKLAALAAFCSLAVAMLLPRLQNVTATSKGARTESTTPALSVAAENREPEFNPVRFNEKSAEYVAGWDKLIDADDHANVGIPDEHDPPSASIIDASSFSRPFKERFMLQETSLRDPRRRIFEERGMTCIQCHVRNFDEGDYLNAAVRDPKAGANFGTTQDISRLFFVLTPDEERSEFFRRNEEEQVGNLKGVMRDYMKVNVNIDSPLSQTWPHNTRLGRS